MRHEPRLGVRVEPEHRRFGGLRGDVMRVEIGAIETAVEGHTQSEQLPQLLCIDRWI